MEPRSRGDNVLVSLIERARDRRQAEARRRRQRRDAWLAATAMLGALLALPLAQTAWHGAEVAAILAIAATAQFAGHRWAIAVIVIAELFLLPTVWPRAFLEGGDLGPRLVALTTLVAMVPSLLAMRRAAAVLAMMAGRRHPRLLRRWFHTGLLISCVIAIALPWL